MSHRSMYALRETILIPKDNRPGSPRERALSQSSSSRFLALLLSFLEDTTRQASDLEEQVNAFRKKLEKWYDEMMDRALGWY